MNGNLEKIDRDGSIGHDRFGVHMSRENLYGRWTEFDQFIFNLKMIPESNLSLES